jgi:hypothetical protein
MPSLKQPIVLSFLLSVLAPVAHADAQPTLTTWYQCPFSADCVASRRYPKGTVLSIHNPKTGKSARGVVRDYGPAAWTGRALDVSRQIAARLGMISTGVAMLEVQVVGRL